MVVPPRTAYDEPLNAVNIRRESQSHDTPYGLGLNDRSILNDDNATQFPWHQSPISASQASARTQPIDHNNIPKDAYAMTGVLGDPSKSVEFFGSSSAGSFMRQINSAIDARLGRTQPNNPDFNSSDADRHLRQATSGRGDSDDPLAYTLPPRRVADDLLNAYWDLLWAVFPIHDRAVFEEAYKSVWEGTTPVMAESILYCMINLTLALGSQFSGLVRPDQRKETGLVFFKRAQKLFSPQMHDNPFLEGVQCLLLMGMFLQSTKESNQCWMVIGSAIRMGQSLGLHLPFTLRGPRGPRDIEIAQRTWYGCVFMDRVLSMTFGRPSMITKWVSDPTLPPTMIDDEFLDAQTIPNATRPDGRPAIVAFFVKALELYSIVNDVLQELYLNHSETGAKEIGSNSLVSVLQFDDRLIAWLQSLPSQLQFSPTIVSEDEPLVFRRQRIVLHIRYLHARMMNFRPIVANFYLKQSSITTGTSDDLPDRSLSRYLIAKCSALCFEAAHEIIDLLYNHMDFETITGPVPAWWFAVLFIYTAATVLLAQRLRPIDSVNKVGSPWEISSSWSRAMEILRAYSRLGESAERCVAALEILSAKVPGESHLASYQQLQTESNPVSRNAVSAGTVSSSGVAVDDLSSAFDFGNIDFDFDIDDMLWLNSNAADILFQ